MDPVPFRRFVKARRLGGDEFVLPEVRPLVFRDLAPSEERPVVRDRPDAQFRVAWIGTLKLAASDEAISYAGDEHAHSPNRSGFRGRPLPYQSGADIGLPPLYAAVAPPPPPFYNPGAPDDESRPAKRLPSTRKATTFHSFGSPNQNPMKSSKKTGNPEKP
jgi:hypothetical protein